MMSPPDLDLRIISLIPSATEIIDALGATPYLVGRSHECDFPSGVEDLPICTRPNLDPSGDSTAIHQQVEGLFSQALSIYDLELETITSLNPTHIVTQAQCEVCAVSFSQVAEAVQTLGNSKPQLISLQPSVLAEMFDDLKRVGDILKLDSELAIATLKARLKRIQEQAITSPKSVACIEWTDPLMAAGNWVPELVTMAGGQDLFGQVGQHSDWMTWDQLLEADPEVVIAMPCGFDLDKTQEAVNALAQDERWSRLSAVQTHQVFLADGNQYFNRPGPRLVDSLQILVEILKAEETLMQGVGWRRWNVC